jgi:hypothetical protein
VPVECALRDAGRRPDVRGASNASAARFDRLGDQPEAGDLLQGRIVSVPKRLTAKDHAADARGIDHHALHAVRRDGALDDRVLAQRLQTLRVLVLPENLLPARLRNFAEGPHGGGRHAERLIDQACQCAHPSPSRLRTRSTSFGWYSTFRPSFQSSRPCR